LVQYEGLWQAAETDEDRALWEEKIIELSGDSFLLQQAAAEEEERLAAEAAAAKEAEAEARRKAIADEKAATKLAAKDTARLEELKTAIDELQPQVDEVFTAWNDRSLAWENENPLDEDDYEGWYNRFDEFIAGLQ
jgi:hypothetical protein